MKIRDWVWLVIIATGAAGLTCFVLAVLGSA